MLTFAVIVLFVVVGLYALNVVKERKAAFQAGADSLGFTYLGSVSPFTGTDCTGLTLITETSRHVYRNVLVSKSGSPVVVPEFQYDLYVQPSLRRTASVSDDDLQNHSLIAYRIPHGSLPVFQVLSRGLFGNMGTPLAGNGPREMLTPEGVDLGSEEFADRYVVTTAEESAVRALFTPALIRAFVEQPPRTWLHVQTSPDWLLFYDPRIRILTPRDVTPALQRLGPLAEMLTGATV
jgi:hypothetical protein